MFNVHDCQNKDSTLKTSSNYLTTTDDKKRLDGQ